AVRGREHREFACKLWSESVDARAEAVGREQFVCVRAAGVMTEQARSARDLIATRRYGALATQLSRHTGFPFASIVEYVVDDAGQPIFLLSSLAVHTKNLAENPKASLLVFAAGTEHNT